jgi:hypothetical protein
VSEQQPETKVCPECAETVKAAARRCRFCGYRFDGAVEARPRQQASAPLATVEIPTTVGKRSVFLIWGLLSALLMLIGSFGPWISTLGGSVAGTDGSNDGWLVVIAAVLGAIILLPTRRYRAAGIWPFLAGIGGAAVTIHDRSHASHFIGRQSTFVRDLVHIGWGLNLAMVASISFAVCGLIWLLAIQTDPELKVSAPELG